MNSFEQERFEEILPAYIKGKASEEECFFVNHLVNTSPKAKSMLLLHTVLAQVVEERVKSARAQFDELSTRFNKPSKTHVEEKASDRPHDKSRWQAVLDFFKYFPQVKMSRNGGLVLHGLIATTTLVVVGIMAVGTPTIQPSAAKPFRLEDVRVKGFAQEQVTLRVVFRPDTTEAQMRKTLQACSAYFVGGPNQLGEYWIYSPTYSQAELKSELMKSGIMDVLEYDPIGPKTP